LGLILIPIVFYPANYYAHFVFLLPLLAVERPWKSQYPTAPAGGVVWIAVTAMCAVQYWTVLVKDLDLHFNYASLILVVTLAVVLVSLLVEDYYSRPAVRLATAGRGSATAKSQRPRRASARPTAPKKVPSPADGSAEATPPAEPAAESVSQAEPAPPGAVTEATAPPKDPAGGEPGSA
jgi:hypothetical protein